tara:strand:+ start:380 stop:562 length:183 start_codon:yes stop_codon:yes gene_type:complete
LKRLATAATGSAADRAAEGAAATLLVLLASTSVSAVLSGVTVLLVAVFLVALVSGHLYNI